MQAQLHDTLMKLCYDDSVDQLFTVLSPVLILRVYLVLVQTIPVLVAIGAPALKDAGET